MMKDFHIVVPESFLGSRSYKFLIIASMINRTDLGNDLADIP